MIKHLLQRFVVFTLTIGYAIGLVVLQRLPANTMIDIISVLTLSIWVYIIFNDFDLKVEREHRLLTSKHLMYEALFTLSLAFITVAYLSKVFALALTMLILSIVTFIGACVLYVYCLKLEGEFVSSEIENCKHMIWVLKHLKNKTEEWDADRLKEYATNEFRLYPKKGNFERGLDGSDPVDTTGSRRTLAEMIAENPNAPEVQIATKRINDMVVAEVVRLHDRKMKMQQKKEKKEVKA